MNVLDNITISHAQNTCRFKQILPCKPFSHRGQTLHILPFDFAKTLT